MTKSKSWKKPAGLPKTRPSKRGNRVAVVSQVLKALFNKTGFAFPAGLPVVIGFREDARVVQAMKAAKTREDLIIPSQVADLTTELFENAQKFKRQLKKGWSFHWKFVKSYTAWTKPLEVDDIISLVEYLIKSRKRYQSHPLNAPLRPSQVTPLVRAIDEYIAMISQDSFKNIVYWNTTLDFDDDESDEDDDDLEEPQWNTMQTIREEGHEDDNNDTVSSSMKRKVDMEDDTEDNTDDDLDDDTDDDVVDVSKMFRSMSMRARPVKTRKIEGEVSQVTKRDETLFGKLSHKMSDMALEDADDATKE